LLDSVPEPDLDAPLDFARLDAGRASEPDHWPHPYRLTDGMTPTLVETEPGHFVCMPGLAGRAPLSSVKEAAS
jgi:peptide/nickel transport system ATP-binding protein